MQSYFLNNKLNTELISPNITYHSLSFNHPPLPISESPIEFTQPLKHQTVPESATVTLECCVNKPDQRAVWLKNGVEIIPDTKHEVVVDGTTHRLILPDVGPDESDEYTCQIGPATTEATLEVEGRFLFQLFGFLKTLFETVYVCVRYRLLLVLFVCE